MLRFGILGPVEVVGDDGPVRLGGPRQRATLALLLLNANRVVSIERLADALYAGRPPVTAVTQVHRQISELRKAVGEGRIRTESPGYAIQVSPYELDLARFEQAASRGTEAAEHGDAAAAVELLEEGLALWRGRPLADLDADDFAAPEVRRLEELQLAARERLLEAKLALGVHGEVVADLELLAARHPTRESLQALRMLALYRSGRQAEALDVFRRVRAELVESFGIEPGSALRELERAMLRQDPSLEGERQEPGPVRAVLVLGSRDEELESLLAVASPLSGARELILARLVDSEREVAPASESLNAQRRRLGGSARCAVFTSSDPAGDVGRLVDSYAVDLVLVGAAPELAGKQVPASLALLFERSQADVAAVAGTPRPGSGVFVPFGGGEHDWAALELAAWLAAAAGAELTLVGTASAGDGGRPDASRLLAHAALAAQRLAGVETRPALAPPTPDDLREAVAGAGVVVTGIRESWRSAGIGDAKRALVASGTALVLVHRGPRPGGLAPKETRTRFSWTLDYPLPQDGSLAVT